MGIDVAKPNKQPPTPEKGGMVKAYIDDIIATEFCKDMLAPVNAAYEDEKARILGEVG